MANTYPGDYTDLAAGSEAFADTVVVYDASASDLQNSGAAQREMTLKELTMGGAWAQTYDAAGSQALSTTPTKLTGGANWDGTFGPAAYNATITATTNDGITTTIAGIYEVTLEMEGALGATNSAIISIRQGGSAITGLTGGIQNGATAAEQAIPKYLRISGRVALAASVLVDVFAASGSATPTLTYQNLRLTLKRVGPSA